MAQRSKTDTVTPSTREATPAPADERQIPAQEPANDNDQIVFSSWDAPLVPPGS